MPTPRASSPSVAARMSRQASRDTAQERAVRSILHRQGLRFRKHVPVPGMKRRTIDIVFGPAHVAVFLDGCFWHSCPEHATRPKANGAWWQTKLDRNVERDVETNNRLTEDGWTVLRFWEHEPDEEIAQRVAAVVHEKQAASASARG